LEELRWDCKVLEARLLVREDEARQQREEELEKELESLLLQVKAIKESRDLPAQKTPKQ
jgi:hypothetical protein